MLGEYPEQNDILTELLEDYDADAIKASLNSTAKKNWSPSLMLTKAKCLALSLQNS